MRGRVIPLMAPSMRRSFQNASVFRETKARGMAVLAAPPLNKGTAFTVEERKALGLTGLLPPAISTLNSQAKGAYAQYQQLPDALSKNIYLTALHDRNEVLFFRLFSEHLREMIPIVNDRTVGMAMEQYHHECRRPYVKAARKRFPQALLQWEDFDPGNGRRILGKYCDRCCTFNDDLQGTGAITLAAAVSAVRVCGAPYAGNVW